PKIYLRDSGLLHRLIGVSTPEALAGHPQIGFSWEGYVIAQIIREADEGSQFYYYRTSNGAEVDLLWISDTGKRICLEIKYSSTPTISRGFYESLKDLKPDFSFIIIPEGESYLHSDGIRVCSLKNFLQVEMPVFQNPPS
ncbi:MAG: DUF4143 domain-containing protein, partial [Saprospiraceae bacterium]|nr:DUF4143 domain-containing protein [Saprospiraceae bacterium]